MAIPNSRDTFREYCLRHLGKGVINIEVTQEQIDDAIDYSLKMYYDYHTDGTLPVYYKHIMTQTDLDNGYVTIPENIIGVVRIFDISSSIGSTNMFSATYQFALSDIWNITSESILPYYMAMERIQFIQQLFVGLQPIRYNRHDNKCYIDMSKGRVYEGAYMIFECYQVVDPDIYTDAWGDRWLAKYATQHIKRQWGENLKKFQGMRMPGDITFNGQQIYEEAEAEIKYLEGRMPFDIAGPDSFFIG